MRSGQRTTSLPYAIGCGRGGEPLAVDGRDPVKPTPEEAGALVRRAALGDSLAWQALVDAYTPLVWTIACNHGLDPIDAADVTQTTWLRLLEHIARLTQPESVAAWLSTTARRECVRTQARAHRLLLIAEEPTRAEQKSRFPEVDEALLVAERDAALKVALEQLPDRCQRLLKLLMQDHPPSYHELADMFGLPIGSIGPTRARCLLKLREIAQTLGIDPEYGRSS
jgi:RNA polymerase sigma factor (sigma-70 family)